MHIRSKRLGLVLAIALSLPSILAALETLSKEALQEEEGDIVSSAEDVVKEHKLEDNGDINSLHRNQETSHIINNNNTSKSSSAAAHEPPSHFHISAHIQTNLHDGISYFLPRDTLKEKSFAHIPFLECGAIGSTTATVPLLSGAFRHVPKKSGVDDDEMKRDTLEYLEESIGVSISSLDEEGEDGQSNHDVNKLFADTKEDTPTSYDEDKEKEPRRPSPPTYVVALSPLEISVGGNGRETRQFDAGDVIFFEDTWIGIWDDVDTMIDESEDLEEDEGRLQEGRKGYTLRATSESKTDLNVISLTIPPSLHRQWKRKCLNKQKQQQKRLDGENKEQGLDAETSILKSQNEIKKSSRWKLPSPWRTLGKKAQVDGLPKPCSLESDPAFAHLAVSVPTTLSQHFSQHFTSLLQQLPLSTSSSSHHEYDLIMPILTQTFAAVIGGVAAFGGVMHFLRVVHPAVAIGFGAACLIGFGTWGIVWLGEELLDEWEMWKERRQWERWMSESASR